MSIDLSGITLAEEDYQQILTKPGQRIDPGRRGHAQKERTDHKAVGHLKERQPESRNKALRRMDEGKSRENRV